MSTPAASGPSDVRDVDRRRSLGKYVKRMSSVFKREKPTTTATTSKSPASASASATAPTQPTVQSTAKDNTSPTPAASNSTPETTTPKPAVSSATGIPPPPAVTVHQVNRSALQQERARLLFAKYGLTLESHEWLATTTNSTMVQRVEKPIRMRVHRECHHCATSFGSEKVCLKCEHKRCKKCPRYPKKKSPADKGKAKESDNERLERPKKKKILTVTTKAGDERVYQTVKQRVRRSCHKCSAFFVPANATVCDKCRHVRCTKCPRDPAKLAKWPHGYPGDVEPDSDTEVERDYEKDLEIARRVWRKPRTRVRWECEECQSQFIEGQLQCPGCGHHRCEKCARWPAKRAKKDPAMDPEVIRKVEAKLRALAVEQGNFAASGPGSP